MRQHHMKNLQFSVTQDVLDLGVQIVTAYMTGITNKDTDISFEKYKLDTLQQIKEKFAGTIYKEDPVLQGFRALHTTVGRSNRDYVASPEALLGRFLKTGTFPHINLLVDIYNLHSLKTQLGLGAHDRKFVKGNISLRLTNGTESFLPLGSSATIPVPQGEYAYIDDGNNIICRLEVLQVEPTKVTLASKDIFFIIEGNANTQTDEVQRAANSLLAMVQTYCGGTLMWLNVNGKEEQGSV